MNRRAFLAALASAVIGMLPAARAQQRPKAWRIGFLHLRPRSAPGSDPLIDPFFKRMRELGYVEGQNLSIEWRWSEGRADQLAPLAVDLVRLNVDVIVVPSTQPALAARQATTVIPIVVMAASDPVATGLIESFAKPGGNVTGANVMGGELSKKRLELLKEMIPKLSRVAVLADPSNPTHAVLWKETELAAQALRVELQRVDVRAPDALDGALAEIGHARADALVVLPEPMLHQERRRINDWTAKNRMPAIFGLRSHVDDGGLMSYAPSYADLSRRAATYVDRILKGAKPADLPFEQPTKFELVVNLRTAKLLGLAMPASLIARADAVLR